MDAWHSLHLSRISGPIMSSGGCLSTPTSCKHNLDIVLLRSSCVGQLKGCSAPSYAFARQQAQTNQLSMILSQ